MFLCISSEGEILLSVVRETPDCIVSVAQFGSAGLATSLKWGFKTTPGAPLTVYCSGTLWCGACLQPAWGNLLMLTC